MGVDLLFFGGSQWPDLAVIASLAIASTLFVHCDLIRRPWYLTFLAVMAIAHLGLVLAFPGAAFNRSELGLFTAADVLGVLGLAFGLEEFVSLRKLAAA